MQKTILVADHRSPTLIALAEHLVDDPTQCRIISARSPEMALELARTYKPDYALVVASFVDATFPRPLPELIVQFSPDTKVIVVADPG
jgi:DNA-binding NarL/FixJ family response regulator